MTDEIIKLNFSRTIYTSIFETAEVKERLDELFTKNRKCMHYRFNQIKDFACSNQWDVATLDACNSMAFDDLQIFLRKRIIERTLEEAVILSLSDKETCYDIKRSVLIVLTEERFKEWWIEELINSIEDIILRLPEKDEIDNIIKEGIVCRIKIWFK